MRALLRADWLRFRRRRDFWIIGIAVLVLGAVSFLASYRVDSADQAWPDAAAIRQEVIDSSQFEGMTQAEIDQQVELMVADRTAMYDEQRHEAEAQQATALQKYDLAQSPFTLLGSAIAPILALVLAASLAVGDEFRFGTIRTSLLAAGSRRRFLAARLISLFVMTIALFVALIVLGEVLGVGLHLVGAKVAVAATPIDSGAALLWFGAQILTTMVLILLGVALTMLLRSGTMPLLLILLGGLIEVFVGALPIFGPNTFLWGVPQTFLAQSMRALTGRLGLDTHAIALGGVEISPTAIELPVIAVAAIIAAWGLLFLFLADRRFRTMDVVE